MTKNMLIDAVLLLLIATGGAIAQDVPTPAPVTPDAPQQIDHSPFNTLLNSHVKGQLVNYSGFKSSPQFTAYLAALGAADLTYIKTKNEKLAFYINAYNALTINQVISNQGISSVMKVPNFFKNRIHKLAGKTVSLDDIENKIIRPTFKDPRIHAALNCASISCPPLASFAFVGSKVNGQLDRTFKAFANDNSRNSVDPATGKVALSKILDWYAVDFKPAGGAAAYLAKFLADGPRKEALLKATVVGFLPYDWNLNKK